MWFLSLATESESDVSETEREGSSPPGEQAAADPEPAPAPAEAARDLWGFFGGQDTKEDAAKDEGKKDEPPASEASAGGGGWFSWVGGGENEPSSASVSRESSVADPPSSPEEAAQGKAPESLKTSSPDGEGSAEEKAEPKVEKKDGAASPDSGEEKGGKGENQDEDKAAKAGEGDVKASAEAPDSRSSASDTPGGQADASGRRAEAPGDALGGSATPPERKAAEEAAPLKTSAETNEPQDKPDDSHTEDEKKEPAESTGGGFWGFFSAPAAEEPSASPPAEEDLPTSSKADSPPPAAESTGVGWGFFSSPLPAAAEQGSTHAGPSSDSRLAPSSATTEGEGSNSSEPVPQPSAEASHEESARPAEPSEASSAQQAPAAGVWSFLGFGGDVEEEPKEEEADEKKDSAEDLARAAPSIHMMGPPPELGGPSGEDAEDGAKREDARERGSGAGGEKEDGTDKNGGQSPGGDLTGKVTESEQKLEGGGPGNQNAQASDKESDPSAPEGAGETKTPQSDTSTPDGAADASGTLPKKANAALGRNKPPPPKKTEPSEDRPQAGTSDGLPSAEAGESPAQDRKDGENGDANKEASAAEAAEESTSSTPQPAKTAAPTKSKPPPPLPKSASLASQGDSVADEPTLGPTAQGDTPNAPGNQPEDSAQTSPTAKPRPHPPPLKAPPSPQTPNEPPPPGTLSPDTNIEDHELTPHRQNTAAREERKTLGEAEAKAGAVPGKVSPAPKAGLGLAKLPPKAKGPPGAKAPGPPLGPKAGPGEKAAAAEGGEEDRDKGKEGEKQGEGEGEEMKEATGEAEAKAGAVPGKVSPAPKAGLGLAKLPPKAKGPPGAKAPGPPLGPKAGPGEKAAAAEGGEEDKDKGKEGEKQGEGEGEEMKEATGEAEAEAKAGAVPGKVSPAPKAGLGLAKLPPKAKSPPGAKAPAPPLGPKAGPGEKAAAAEGGEEDKDKGKEGEKQGEGEGEEMKEATGEAEAKAGAVPGKVSPAPKAGLGLAKLPPKAKGPPGAKAPGPPLGPKAGPGEKAAAAEGGEEDKDKGKEGEKQGEGEGEEMKEATGEAEAKAGAVPGKVSPAPKAGLGLAKLPPKARSPPGVKAPGPPLGPKAGPGEKAAAAEGGEEDKDKGKEGEKQGEGEGEEMKEATGVAEAKAGAVPGKDSPAPKAGLGLAKLPPKAKGPPGAKAPGPPLGPKASPGEKAAAAEGGEEDKDKGKEGEKQGEGEGEEMKEATGVAEAKAGAVPGKVSPAPKAGLGLAKLPPKAKGPPGAKAPGPPLGPKAGPGEKAAAAEGGEEDRDKGKEGEKQGESEGEEMKEATGEAEAKAGAVPGKVSPAPKAGLGLAKLPPKAKSPPGAKAPGPPLGPKAGPGEKAAAAEGGEEDKDKGKEGEKQGEGEGEGEEMKEATGEAEAEAGAVPGKDSAAPKAGLGLAKLPPKAKGPPGAKAPAPPLGPKAGPGEKAAAAEGGEEDKDKGKEGEKQGEGEGEEMKEATGEADAKAGAVPGKVSPAPKAGLGLDKLPPKAKGPPGAKVPGPRAVLGKVSPAPKAGLGLAKLPPKAKGPPGAKAPAPPLGPKAGPGEKAAAAEGGEEDKDKGKEGEKQGEGEGEEMKEATGEAEAEAKAGAVPGKDSAAPKAGLGLAKLPPKAKGPPGAKAPGPPLGPKAGPGEKAAAAEGGEEDKDKGKEGEKQGEGEGEEMKEATGEADAKAGAVPGKVSPAPKAGLGLDKLPPKAKGPPGAKVPGPRAVLGMVGPAPRAGLGLAKLPPKAKGPPGAKAPAPPLGPKAGPGEKAAAAEGGEEDKDKGKEGEKQGEAEGEEMKEATGEAEAKAGAVPGKVSPAPKAGLGLAKLPPKAKSPPGAKAPGPPLGPKAGPGEKAAAAEGGEEDKDKGKEGEKQGEGEGEEMKEATGEAEAKAGAVPGKVSPAPKAGLGLAKLPPKAKGPPGAKAPGPPLGPKAGPGEKAAAAEGGEEDKDKGKEGEKQGEGEGEEMKEATGEAEAEAKAGAVPGKVSPAPKGGLGLAKLPPKAKGPPGAKAPAPPLGPKAGPGEKAAAAEGGEEDKDKGKEGEKQGEGEGEEMKEATGEAEAKAGAVPGKVSPAPKAGLGLAKLPPKAKSPPGAKAPGPPLGPKAGPGEKAAAAEGGEEDKDKGKEGEKQGEGEGEEMKEATGEAEAKAGAVPGKVSPAPKAGLGLAKLPPKAKGPPGAKAPGPPLGPKAGPGEKAAAAEGGEEDKDKGKEGEKQGEGEGEEMKEATGEAEAEAKAGAVPGKVSPAPKAGLGLAKLPPKAKGPPGAKAPGPPLGPKAGPGEKAAAAEGGEEDKDKGKEGEKQGEGEGEEMKEATGEAEAKAGAVPGKVSPAPKAGLGLAMLPPKAKGPPGAKAPGPPLGPKAGPGEKAAAAEGGEEDKDKGKEGEKQGEGEGEEMKEATGEAEAKAGAVPGKVSPAPKAGLGLAKLPPKAKEGGEEDKDKGKEGEKQGEGEGEEMKEATGEAEAKAGAVPGKVSPAPKAGLGLAKLPPKAKGPPGAKVPGLPLGPKAGPGEKAAAAEGGEEDKVKGSEGVAQIVENGVPGEVSSSVRGTGDWRLQSLAVSKAGMRGATPDSALDFISMFRQRAHQVLDGSQSDAGPSRVDKLSGHLAQLSAVLPGLSPRDGVGSRLSALRGSILRGTNASDTSRLPGTDVRPLAIRVRASPLSGKAGAVHTRGDSFPNARRGGLRAPGGTDAALSTASSRRESEGKNALLSTNLDLTRVLESARAPTAPPAASQAFSEAVCPRLDLGSISSGTCLFDVGPRAVLSCSAPVCSPLDVCLPDAQRHLQDVHEQLQLATDVHGAWGVYDAPDGVYAWDDSGVRTAGINSTSVTKLPKVLFGAAVTAWNETLVYQLPQVILLVGTSVEDCDMTVPGLIQNLVSLGNLPLSLQPETIRYVNDACLLLRQMGSVRMLKRGTFSNEADVPNTCMSRWSIKFTRKGEFSGVSVASWLLDSPGLRCTVHGIRQDILLRLICGIVGNEDSFLGPSFPTGSLMPLFEQDAAAVGLSEEDRLRLAQDCVDLLARVLKLDDVQVTGLVSVFLSVSALAQETCCLSAEAVAGVALLLGVSAPDLQGSFSAALAAGHMEAAGLGEAIAKVLYQELFQYTVARINSVMEDYSPRGGRGALSVCVLAAPTDLEALPTTSLGRLACHVAQAVAFTFSFRGMHRLRKLLHQDRFPVPEYLSGLREFCPEDVYLEAMLGEGSGLLPFLSYGSKTEQEIVAWFKEQVNGCREDSFPFFSRTFKLVRESSLDIALPDYAAELDVSEASMASQPMDPLVFRVIECVAKQAWPLRVLGMTAMARSTAAHRSESCRLYTSLADAWKPLLHSRPIILQRGDAGGWTALSQALEAVTQWEKHGFPLFVVIADLPTYCPNLFPPDCAKNRDLLVDHLSAYVDFEDALLGSSLLALRSHAYERLQSLQLEAAAVVAQRQGYLSSLMELDPEVRDMVTTHQENEKQQHVAGTALNGGGCGMQPPGWRSLQDAAKESADILDLDYEGCADGKLSIEDEERREETPCEGSVSVQEYTGLNNARYAFETPRAQGKELVNGTAEPSPRETFARGSVRSLAYSETTIEAHREGVRGTGAPSISSGAAEQVAEVTKGTACKAGRVSTGSSLTSAADVPQVCEVGERPKVQQSAKESTTLVSVGNFSRCGDSEMANKTPHLATDVTGASAAKSSILLRSTEELRRENARLQLENQRLNAENLRLENEHLLEENERLCRENALLAACLTSGSSRTAGSTVLFPLGESANSRAPLSVSNPSSSPSTATHSLPTKELSGASGTDQGTPGELEVGGSADDDGEAETSAAAPVVAKSLKMPPAAKKLGVDGRKVAVPPPKVTTPATATSVAPKPKGLSGKPVSLAAPKVAVEAPDKAEPSDPNSDQTPAEDVDAGGSADDGGEAETSAAAPVVAKSLKMPPAAKKLGVGAKKVGVSVCLPSPKVADRGGAAVLRAAKLPCLAPKPSLSPGAIRGLQEEGSTADAAGVRSGKAADAAGKLFPGAKCAPKVTHLSSPVAGSPLHGTTCSVTAAPGDEGRYIPVSSTVSQSTLGVAAHHRQMRSDGTLPTDAHSYDAYDPCSESAETVEVGYEDDTDGLVDGMRALWVQAAFSGVWKGVVYWPKHLQNLTEESQCKRRLSGSDESGKKVVELTAASFFSSFAEAARVDADRDQQLLVSSGTSRDVSQPRGTVRITRRGAPGADGARVPSGSRAAAEQRAHLGSAVVVGSGHGQRLLLPSDSRNEGLPMQLLRDVLSSEDPVSGGSSSHGATWVLADLEGTWNGKVVWKPPSEEYGQASRDLSTIILVDLTQADGGLADSRGPLKIFSTGTEGAPRPIVVPQSGESIAEKLRTIFRTTDASGVPIGAGNVYFIPPDQAGVLAITTHARSRDTGLCTEESEERVASFCDYGERRRKVQHEELLRRLDQRQRTGTCATKMVTAGGSQAAEAPGSLARPGGARIVSTQSNLALDEESSYEGFQSVSAPLEEMG
ncbi:hypothetical protein BESB_062090 [Besnoitia besnoiti]|uniref:Uncharacterized protein n=1 Tax=Besnoitia besnoiti TaxID=94643 RepID=A0A2A9MIV9_BESBE|nr:hypothetical protein BESB_062090 [Besnoitia besnoiti]PFH35322.1 hypothetical protein BESB_062090 [Besnoitia besnoiti]